MAPVLAIQSAKINRPFAGHFASYQMVMASMGRNMLHENFTQPFLPKTELLVNGKKGLHLNQYPFPSVVAAFGVKFFKGGFEFWGRFQSILCNTASIVLVGLIAALLWNEAVAWIAMVVFAYSPYTIIYGQGFFSEPMSLLFFLLSLLFVLKKSCWKKILFSALCFSVAVTGRIHWVLFFPLPALWILFFHDSKDKILKFLGFSVLAGAMPLAWYGYTYFEGLKTDHLLTNAFLQVGMRQVADHKYLADPEYYRHLIDIVAGTMLTPLFFPFLFFGFLTIKNLKKLFFIYLGILPGVLVILLSPQKIMAHDFYLYPVFPFIALAAAAGISQCSQSFPMFQKFTGKAALAVLYLIISARFFYHPVFKYEENISSMKAASLAIKQNTKPEDKVIVAAWEPAGLVYYGDRPAMTLELASLGKPLPGYLTNPKYTKVDLAEIARQESAMKDPIAWLEYLRAKGGAFLVTPDKKDLQNTPLLSYLEARYKKLSSQSDGFYLFRLEA